ncbi:glycosyltransferase [Novosphingobium sp. RD2P27]|uniref:Glycosyltransferase n=1 Tax=Novosphingobium kalidii TaxID=3230299 RepID=A0ABV2D4R5_9SPHN
MAGVAGQYATFDGIFGAFFDGYWRRFTNVDDLALVLDLTGCIEITVDRVASPSGQTFRIVHTVLQGAGERLVVPVPMDAPGETRLVLTVRLIDDSKIGSLAWATFVPPARRVALTAVICTFNRERDVTATLEELLQKNTGIHRVLVVNQGEAGLSSHWEHLRSARDAGILHVVDQLNLGGAGGFGRGMLESLSDEHCSHLLLMDDDIDLDASSIERLITALSYLKSDHAIGGAMLDRNSRTRLFSVGDVLDHRKPEIRNLVDPDANDITDEATSRYLARHHQPDFNGWWFFAFSKDHVRRVGLPLPLFIRGDDVEYGYRLTVTGTRTVAWPGLAVWHEPFHTKRQPWHYFYDRRNSLFLCEAHGRLGRFRLLGSLITGFLNHLLRFDYDRARCITLGLRAFNDGSENLKRWSGSDHMRLARTFGSRELPITEGVELRLVAASRMPTLPLFLARLVKDLLWSRSSGGIPAAMSARYWRPVVQHRPSPVSVHYEDSGTRVEFRHSRHCTRACCLAFAREMLRFLIRPWRPASLKALTHRDFWSCYTS